MVTGLAWINDKEFVTIGVKHIKFWTINGRNVTAKKGSTGGEALIPLTSVAVVNGTTVTGTFKGEISTWKAGSMGKAV